MKNEDNSYSALINRESEIYINFELKIKELSTNTEEIAKNFDYIAYLFCRECSFRDIDSVQNTFPVLSYDIPPLLEDDNCLTGVYTTTEEEQRREERVKNKKLEFQKAEYKNIYLGETIISYASETLKDRLIELYKKNKSIFAYYANICSKSLIENDYYYEIKPIPFKTKYPIQKENLIYAIGENRVKELYGSKIDDILDLNIISKKLTSYDKEQILSVIYKIHHEKPGQEPKAFIVNANKTICPDQYFPKSFFVELDFTKSKKQLMNHINLLIDEYHKEGKPIKNIIDFLKEDDEFYSEEMSHIMKTNKNVPLHIRLTDMLYIYDNIHFGCTIRNIANDINVYHGLAANLKRGSDYRGTVDNYAEIMKLYIDNKKYLEYFSQYAKIEHLSVAYSLDYINSHDPMDLFC